MGVAPSFLPFLDQVHARRPFAGPALGLGTLDLSGDLARFGDREIMLHGGRRAVGDLLRRRYGVNDYRDADINGLADLWLDLGAPLPSSLRGRYRLVLNAGTAEHVFDLRQCLANIHDLLTPGGMVLHIAPLSWMEHGLVNLSARLFRLIAQANEYAVEGEAVWRPAPKEEADEEGVLAFGPEFADPRDPDERWLPETMHLRTTVPARLLYFGAFTKIADRPFAVATDLGT